MAYQEMTEEKLTEIVSKYKVPNLIRAFEILEVIGRNNISGLTIAELSKNLAYPKNSMFRIAMSLLALGYLDRDQSTKRFFLTKKLLTLGTLAIHEESLVEHSIDIMRSLRDKIGETVLIGILLDDRVVVMEQVLGLQTFKFTIDLGSRVEIHSSAPGKAICAFLPESEKISLLDHLDFVKHNERTIINKDAFNKELDIINNQGYSCDYAEQISGVHCLAAPIFNNNNFPIAAIWTTGPSDRIPVGDFEKIGMVVREHADMISRRFGYNLLESEPE